MSTIFSTSYADTLRRIQGEKQQPTVKSSDTRFNELLSEMENKQQVTVEDKARGSLNFDTIKSDELETNLSLMEKDRILQIDGTQTAEPSYRLSPKELTQGPQITTPNPVIMEQPKTTDAPKVESSARIPPKPLLPTSIPTGKPPASPKIMSARATDLPAAPINLEPQVVNVKADAESVLEEIIANAGKKHGIDPSLSIAVARAESSLNPQAISKDGHHSKGMFQLLDTTGRELMERLDVDGAYTPFDPAQNADLGVGYLRRLHELFSKEADLGFNLKTSPVKSSDDLEKVAVAAFNAGEGNVARAQRTAKSLGKDPGLYSSIAPHLPTSTRAYVERVSALKARIDSTDDDNALA